MSNQAIKVGELHPVYDDPINRQKCVGMAKIKKIRKDYPGHNERYDVQGITLWACDVVFQGEREKYTMLIAVDNDATNLNAGD